MSVIKSPVINVISADVEIQAIEVNNEVKNDGNCSICSQRENRNRDYYKESKPLFIVLLQNNRF